LRRDALAVPCVVERFAAWVVPLAAWPDFAPLVPLVAALLAGAALPCEFAAGCALAASASAPIATARPNRHRLNGIIEAS
jgi:hypothetical protein